MTAGKHHHLQCSSPTGCATAGAGWSTAYRSIVCLELERTPRDHSVPAILLWPETPCLCTSASSFPDNTSQSNCVSFLQKNGKLQCSWSFSLHTCSLLLHWPTCTLGSHQCLILRTRKEKKSYKNCISAAAEQITAMEMIKEDSHYLEIFMAGYSLYL